MCKHQIRVRVQDISNDYVHFERILDTSSFPVSFPYEKIVDSLLFLYQGLNVKVVCETADDY